MTMKAEGRARVGDLAHRFQSMMPAQVRDTNQEANTRKDFVLPLMAALGWNIDSVEVVIEDRRAGRRDD